MGPANFNGNEVIGLYAYGTADAPVFIRGVPGALPTIAKQCFLFGNYTICESLSFINDAGIKFRPDLDARHGDTDHIALRHLVMHGTGTASGAGGICGIGSWKNPVYPWTSHVLIWDNVISEYGNWKAGFENDSQCVSTHGFNCSDIWILDNDFSHAGGDAIRIGSNPVAAYPTYTSRRIYVGRNKLHDNRENGLDIKGVYDVVVSENEMWGAARTSSSAGAAIAAHYKCDNIWIV